MQVGTFAARPWKQRKTALAELTMDEAAVIARPAFPRVFERWEPSQEIPSNLETLSKGPTPPNASSTSAINEDIEGLLNWLARNQIRVISPHQVREYLLGSPDLIDVIPSAVEAARRHFPEAQLVLQVYRDPEIEDSYLALYIRCREYDESILDRIEKAESEFLELLTDKSGWLQLTTDFEQPEGTDAV